ncbi:hypothetical protein [Candidatus Nitrotoga sp. 1052]|nr:hypothetical protein [Candidatus Nitrotoga sp. 1052]
MTPQLAFWMPAHNTVQRVSQAGMAERLGRMNWQLANLRDDLTGEV